MAETMAETTQWAKYSSFHAITFLLPRFVFCPHGTSVKIPMKALTDRKNSLLEIQAIF